MPMKKSRIQYIKLFTYTNIEGVVSPCGSFFRGLCTFHVQGCQNGDGNLTSEGAWRFCKDFLIIFLFLVLFLSELGDCWHLTTQQASDHHFYSFWVLTVVTEINVPLPVCLTLFWRSETERQQHLLAKTGPPPKSQVIVFFLKKLFIRQMFLF